MKEKPAPTPVQSGALIQAAPDARSAVRTKLMRAGVLATDLGIPHNLAPVSDEELELTGDMRPGARSSEALVDEDRGA